MEPKITSDNQAIEILAKSPPPAIKPQQCDRKSYVGQDGRTYNKTGTNGEIYFNLGPNNEQLWIKKDDEEPPQPCCVPTCA